MEKSSGRLGPQIQEMNYFLGYFLAFWSLGSLPSVFLDPKSYWRRLGITLRIPCKASSGMFLLIVPTILTNCLKEGNTEHNNKLVQVMWKELVACLARVAQGLVGAALRLELAVQAKASEVRLGGCQGRRTGVPWRCSSQACSLVRGGSNPHECFLGLVRRNLYFLAKHN